MKTGLALAGLLSLTLVGCGGDVHSTKITPEMFEHPEQVRKVANRLKPEERELFGRYAMGRMMAGSFPARPLVNAKGQDPATVGEAIELMRQEAVTDAKVEALQKERDAKVAVLEKQHDALEEKARLAGWAPAETDAANAMIPQIKAVQDEYNKKIGALDPRAVPIG